jgi:hypothetical protein
MAVTQISPPAQALADGLNQALGALLSLSGLADGLSDRTTIATVHVLSAGSVAEVVSAAVYLGVESGWAGPLTYRTTRTVGTVTITVEFTADPFTALAGTAGLPGRAA